MICDAPTTLEECKNALDQLHTNKFPGMNGFTTEFYKAFWNDIKTCLFDTIAFLFKICKLTESQYQGVITLIPKPDKNHLLECNYRPITLLNYDYKIISKVINNRLKYLLHHLVSNEKNGFTKGRYIENNTRLMFDFIDYADCHNKQSTLLSLDMCKTFDSLKWTFISKVLECYGFGDKFLRFLKTVYNNPSCCIINNIYMCSFFEVPTGVRLGDPLSSTIYVYLCSA